MFSSVAENFMTMRQTTVF